MSNATEEIIGGMAEVFDGLRGELMIEGSRCFLLKRDGQTKLFASVAEMTSAWFVKFNEYRGQMKFQFATAEAGFNDTVSQASFIGYGVPDGDSQIEVFEIDADRRDVIPPTGTSPLWKVYATKMPTERFTVSTP